MGGIAQRSEAAEDDWMTIRDWIDGNGPRLMRIEFARPELLYLLLLLPLWGLLAWPRAGRGVLYTHGNPGRGPDTVAQPAIDQ